MIGGRFRSVAAVDRAGGEHLEQLEDRPGVARLLELILHLLTDINRIIIHPDPHHCPELFVLDPDPAEMKEQVNSSD